jgi:hypothetical protein
VEGGAIRTLVREGYFVNGTLVGSGAVARVRTSRIQITGEISPLHSKYPEQATVVESRKTKAELEQEIAFLRARVNEKEAVMYRSVGVRRSIAKVESKALQKLLERLIEQLHSGHYS